MTLVVGVEKCEPGYIGAKSLDLACEVLRTQCRIPHNMLGSGTTDAGTEGRFMKTLSKKSRLMATGCAFPNL